MTRSLSIFAALTAILITVSSNAFAEWQRLGIQNGEWTEWNPSEVVKDGPFKVTVIRLVYRPPRIDRSVSPTRKVHQHKWKFEIECDSKIVRQISYIALDDQGEMIIGNVRSTDYMKFQKPNGTWIPGYDQFVVANKICDPTRQ